jgi:hypothetical protein
MKQLYVGKEVQDLIYFRGGPTNEENFNFCFSFNYYGS